MVFIAWRPRNPPEPGMCRKQEKTMQHIKHQPSPNLAKKRIRTYWHLHNQAVDLLEEHLSPDHFSDPAVHEDIRNALKNKGLVQFNRALRAAVCKLRPGIDSSHIWGAIDATGFWEDTTPGRWPCMTEARAEVLLAWASSYSAGQPFMTDKSQAA
jgi:hypothetical protein